MCSSDLTHGRIGVDQLQIGQRQAQGAVYIAVGFVDQLPIQPFALRRVSMKRLLNNLIGNALHHAGSDVEVAAYVSGDSAAPYVVLSVMDRGTGIDPAELEGIFNPFTRGDRARGGKGTGLGLAIVRRIASMHGGNVELRNREGGGLEARVRLPLGLMLPRDAV